MTVRWGSIVEVSVEDLIVFLQAGTQTNVMDMVAVYSEAERVR